MRSSVAGIIVTAKDGNAVVQKEEDEEEEEGDADGRSADPVDGIGFSGGEKGGDERAAIGGEELNGEEEDDGEEEEAEGAEELGDGFGDGLALITEKEREDDNNGHDESQKDAMGRTALSFFDHIEGGCLPMEMCGVEIRASVEVVLRSDGEPQPENGSIKNRERK